MISIMSLLDRLRLLSSSRRRFNPGEFLFHQGDPVNVLHLIEGGEAHLVRHQHGGSSLTLQRARAGSLLAEASLFAERYHCDGIAIRAAVTLLLPRLAVRRALECDPGLARAWSAFLAREVQAARLRAEFLSLRTVAERLDAWLASNGGRLPAKGDWKTVASEIGVSPEALYRELGKRRARSAHPLKTAESAEP